jgi:hypothetical protein
VISHAIEMFRLICEWASLGIELLAVAVIVVEVVILGLQHGTLRYLLKLGNPSAHGGLQAPNGERVVTRIESADGGGRNPDCGARRHHSKCCGSGLAGGCPHVPELVVIGRDPRPVAVARPGSFRGRDTTEQRVLGSGECTRMHLGVIDFSAEMRVSPERLLRNMRISAIRRTEASINRR